MWAGSTMILRSRHFLSLFRPSGAATYLHGPHLGTSRGSVGTDRPHRRPTNAHHDGAPDLPHARPPRPCACGCKRSHSDRAHMSLASLMLVVTTDKWGPVTHAHPHPHPHAHPHAQVGIASRVASPLVTTNMRLARDMRARCVSDRLRPHAYDRGGFVCGECAVMAHVYRPPVRTVGPDGAKFPSGNHICLGVNYTVIYIMRYRNIYKCHDCARL